MFTAEEIIQGIAAHYQEEMDALEDIAATPPQSKEEAEVRGDFMSVHALHASAYKRLLAEYAPEYCQGLLREDRKRHNAIYDELDRQRGKKKPAGDQISGKL